LSVRRFLIATVLPAVFALVPLAAGGVIAAALPADARRDYWTRLQSSPFDWVILGLGAFLFLLQTRLAFSAMRWQTFDFNTRPDKWLAHLGQAAEWFPLLGLIGTVAAILQTFGSITPGSTPTPQDIIRRYAPAITATGSGLFMALLNILPGWMVTTGRDLIRGLSGDDAPVPLTPEGRP
jgi:preprotein translocase subunit SecY